MAGYQMKNRGAGEARTVEPTESPMAGSTARSSAGGTDAQRALRAVAETESTWVVVKEAMRVAQKVNERVGQMDGTMAIYSADSWDDKSASSKGGWRAAERE